MEVRACARRNADLVRFPGALAGAQDRRVRRGKTAWKEDKRVCFAQPVSWLLVCFYNFQLFCRWIIVNPYRLYCHIR